MVPLVPLDTFRSWTAAPRKARGAMCRRATVAGVRNPLNLPSMTSWLAWSQESALWSLLT